MNNCCKCTLVSEQCLRAYTGFAKYVRYEDLQPHLLPVHEIYVVELIGLECFDVLCEAYASETLTDIQAQLVTLLEPWISLLTGFYYLDFTVYATGIGAKVIQNQATKTPDKHEVEHQKARLRNDIARYKDRFLAFLKNNQSEFPCLPQGCQPRYPNAWIPLFTWAGNATDAQSLDYPQYYKNFYDSRRYYDYLFSFHYDSFFIN